MKTGDQPLTCSENIENLNIYDAMATTKAPPAGEAAERLLNEPLRWDYSLPPNPLQTLDYHIYTLQ